jgi:hypothetical protein
MRFDITTAQLRQPEAPLTESSHVHSARSRLLHLPTDAVTLGRVTGENEAEKCSLQTSIGKRQLTN